MQVELNQAENYFIQKDFQLHWRMSNICFSGISPSHNRSETTVLIHLHSVIKYDLRNLLNYAPKRCLKDTLQSGDSNVTASHIFKRIKGRI